MKVIVRGKNKFEPSEKVKNYATDKLQKINQYFRKPEELEANVLCKIYDTYQVVEVTIPTKHIILRTEVKDDTLFGAIDRAVDKLESQMRKQRTKIYKSIKQRDGISGFYASNDNFDLEHMQAEIKGQSLVKEKKVELQPMTVDDAILQMEMLDHNFYVFLNSETGKTCVVYLREDQDYGIIETK